MSKNTTLGLALVLVAALGALHFLAGAFYFYWIYWWYDVMMHFLAGVALGFFVYWVCFKSGVFSKVEPRRVRAVLLTLLLVFLAGVTWEVFEYVNGFTDSQEGYRLDTINDLILDSVGAVLAGLIATRKRTNGSMGSL